MPVLAQGVHFEETFQAALANAVDNFRSLQPLHPQTYNYEIELPTQQQLQAMGVTLQGTIARTRANQLRAFSARLYEVYRRSDGREWAFGHDSEFGERTADRHVAKER